MALLIYCKSGSGRVTFMSFTVSVLTNNQLSPARCHRMVSHSQQLWLLNPFYMGRYF